MSDIKIINNFLNATLNSDNINDIALNGIQIENEGKIKKISFAVDASLNAIEQAIKNNSNLLIVHHGFYWGKQISITGIFKQRIKKFLDNNIGLIAYHLPLDLHYEYGNNIQILKKIIIEKNKINPFGIYHGITIGWQAELKEAIFIEKIFDFLKIKKENSNYLDFGKKNIKKIGVVSGGGDFAFDEAVNNNLDLFITGDSSHILYHPAKENKINVLFAGHYFTETFGVLALQKLIEDNFSIETEFLNLPTDL